jgi:hypothetical protein
VDKGKIFLSTYEMTEEQLLKTLVELEAGP